MQAFINLCKNINRIHACIAAILPQHYIVRLPMDNSDLDSTPSTVIEDGYTDIENEQADAPADAQTLAHTPADAPADAPADTPADAHGPADAPADTPAHTPADTPADAPAMPKWMEPKAKYKAMPTRLPPMAKAKYKAMPPWMQDRVALMRGVPKSKLMARPVD